MAYSAVNRPEGLLDRLVPTAYGDEPRGQWPEQIRAEEREMAGRMVRMGELMVAGKPPSDTAVLDELDWYYRLANQYGGVNAVTFNALGDALVEHEQIRAAFDDVAEGLAVYQREAFTVYAQARLTEGGA
jgi:TipAS antibiotic-recognition protein